VCEYSFSSFRSSKRVSWCGFSCLCCEKSLYISIIGGFAYVFSNDFCAVTPVENIKFTSAEDRRKNEIIKQLPSAQNFPCINRFIGFAIHHCESTFETKFQPFAGMIKQGFLLLH